MRPCIDDLSRAYHADFVHINGKHLQGETLLMNTKHNPPSKNPIDFNRIIKAFGYSYAGLKHATENEPAFQQELIAVGIMTIIALCLPFTAALKLAIIISHLLILIIELLNSAIEAVVDKASPEYNVLAKQAKDMGSAAVLLTFFASISLWVYAVYTCLTS